MLASQIIRVVSIKLPTDLHWNSFTTILKEMIKYLKIHHINLGIIVGGVEKLKVCDLTAKVPALLQLLKYSIHFYINININTSLPFSQVSLFSPISRIWQHADLTLESAELNMDRWYTILDLLWNGQSLFSLFQCSFFKEITKW